MVITIQKGTESERQIQEKNKQINKVFVNKNNKYKLRIAYENISDKILNHRMF